MTGTPASAPRMPFWQVPANIGAPLPATHTPGALPTPASSATGTPPPASAPSSPLPAWLVPSSHNPELPGAQYVPNFSEDAKALGAAGNTSGSPRAHELAIAAAVAVAVTLAVHLWRKHHHHAG